jgi:hypothetical protein
MMLHRRPPPRTQALGRRCIGTLALACCACIIPDRDIRLEVEAPANQSPVRIIEPSPLVQEMREICERPAPKSEHDPKPDATFCPQVEAPAVRSGLVRPERGALCVCPPDFRDGNAIPRFEIQAEDGDLVRASSSGGLYGVFLLDLDPSSEAPESAVAYLSHWNAQRAPLPFDPPVGSVGREEVTHWEFRIGRRGEDRIDLCNDNGGKRLDPGLHNLQFMVTDRPWFTPQELDEDGNPQMRDGKPVYGNTQYGVPDLAAGATYDTVAYVFECREYDPDDPDCNCEEIPS